MDVREKLVEILQDENNPVWRWFPNNATMAQLADYLINSGVTVQEWVSVDDRLPKDDSDVLAYSRIGEESRIYPACYSNGVWFDCVFNAPATDTTTHWMPMPNPPKGE